MGVKYRFLKDLFSAEIKEEIKKFPPSDNSPLSEEDIAHLPDSVKNYIRSCGYVGKPRTDNARIFWKDVSFKRSKTAQWLKLDCLQFNSVPEPCRIVYMKSFLGFIFPFEGRDKYQNGIGNMFIKILYLLKVQDAKSREMDCSGLVTTLAETLLLPWQALQPYIKWSEYGPDKAKATIEFGGNKVSGIFEFNENYEMTRFVSDDRFQSQSDSSSRNIRWAAVSGNYIEKDGIKFPSSFSGVWYQDEGELEYFKGTIDSILYNITEFNTD